MEKKIIKLKEAIEVGGKALAELEMRRSTIGDEEDAMQTAVEMKRARNPLTVEMCLLAKLTRLPYDKIRRMHPEDYQALRAALVEMSGLSPAEADANPMMPETN